LTRSRGVITLHGDDGLRTGKDTAMSRTSSSKALVAEIQQVIAGLQKHYAGQTLVLAQVSVKVADLIKELTAFVAQVGEATATHLTWLAQVKAMDSAADTRINPTLVTLHRFLEGQFGMTSPTLADFGMTPRSPRKRTAQEKVETAQKSAATRTARHTLGPRQKEKIHGAVPGAPTVEPEAPKR
jgi:hypothetical protein